jgi:hypothetical protein
VPHFGRKRRHEEKLEAQLMQIARSDGGYERHVQDVLGRFDLRSLVVATWEDGPTTTMEDLKSC